MNDTLRHWWPRFYLAFLGPNFSYSLVWPAAAGNVFWSLLWLAIDYDSRTRAGDQWWPRMVLLLVLSAYLTFDWQREQMLAKPPSPQTPPPQQGTIRYWLFEELHLLAIVSVAILTATNASVWWVLRGLGSLFAVTAAGHLIGAWNRHLVSTFGKLGANLGGLGLSFWVATEEPWRPAQVMLIVLVIWIVIVAGEHLKWSFLFVDVGERWSMYWTRRREEAKKAEEEKKAKAHEEV